MKYRPITNIEVYKIIAENAIKGWLGNVEFTKDEWFEFITSEIDDVDPEELKNIIESIYKTID